MLEREAKETIKNIADTFKILLVTGPRQVGKTTLLKSIMPNNMNYVSLDDKSLREMAQKEPKLFLKEHPYLDVPFLLILKFLCFLLMELLFLLG